MAGEGEGGMVGERGHRGSWRPGSAERERDVTMGGVWREMGGVGEGVRVGWRPSGGAFTSGKRRSVSPSIHMCPLPLYYTVATSALCDCLSIHTVSINLCIYQCSFLVGCI